MSSYPLGHLNSEAKIHIPNPNPLPQGQADPCLQQLPGATILASQVFWVAVKELN